MISEEKKAYLKALGQRIKKLRTDRGLTQQELADLCGFSGRSTINRLEVGRNDINQNKLRILAEALRVDVADILYTGTDEEHNVTATKIPVLGSVKAGVPLEAITDILGYEEIPKLWTTQGQFFGLCINGDSMSPYFLDGDIVIVKKQDNAENGDIVIALVNGNDACCKKYFKNQNGVTLHSLNPVYEPMAFSAEEVDTLPVQVIGVVVELRRTI